MNQRPYPWSLLAWFAPVAALLAFVAVPRPVDPVIVVFAFVSYLIATALGLFFAMRIAADTPSGPPWPIVPLTPRSFVVSASWGVLLGAIAFAALFVASQEVPAALIRVRERMALPVWKRLVLAVHAGISEEIAFRLLALSAIIWIALLILRRARARVSPSRVFWTGNAAIAILFGVAHLPAWAAVTTVSVPLAAGVILVNGVIALVLGNIYWRYGIVAAAVAHTFADAVLWGVGPWLLTFTG